MALPVYIDVVCQDHVRELSSVELLNPLLRDVVKFIAGLKIKNAVENGFDGCACGTRHKTRAGASVSNVGGVAPGSRCQPGNNQGARERYA